MRVLLRLGYLGRLLFFKNIFSYYILFLLHFFKCLLIYLKLLLHRLFSSSGSRGYSSLQCADFSWLWILLFWATALGDAASVAAASVAAIPGLQGTGSVIVMLGLHRSMACGIFPHQGSNLWLLHWQAGSLPLSHQRSPRLITEAFFVTAEGGELECLPVGGRLCSRPAEDCAGVTDGQ